LVLRLPDGNVTTIAAGDVFVLLPVPTVQVDRSRRC
jgi:hypothetical protein